MTRLDELRHIAERAGIGTRHYDALGVLHEPDEEALSRLITALGLPDEPQRAADFLRTAQAALPLGLEPVYILPEENEHRQLRLRAAGPVEWHCTREDGTGFEGRCEASDAAPELLLPLPAGLPLGYHRLMLRAAGSAAATTLIVAPAACYLPPGLQSGDRSWGLTTQLYGLRSDHHWGFGDFTDLATLSRGAGALGAATVGINPLHALFAAEPRHRSPYSPSSRNWLDYMYIDVTAAPGAEAAADALAPMRSAAVQDLRTAPLVDRAAVDALKRPALEALFRTFRERLASGPLGDEFRKFQRHGGAPLASFALFEALHGHFLAQGGSFSWRDWPAPFRDPHSDAVAEFARSHAEQVEFFQFLQWVADRQLGAAGAAGRTAGLTLGLYRDLAVGVDPLGADAWADQELIAPGAAIGAPPDPLSRAGQNWGLAPLNPLVLRRRGFAPFIAALRANMRHAGILRIDHVMGLQRLYWVPRGSPTVAGAYINYPLEDLLRLVALESHRQRCAVIGEDLGTVPEGFRDRAGAANMLSYRVFIFERRGDGEFIPPRDYLPLAAASAATHDLATIEGFWLGRDIAWRLNLGAYPDEAAANTEAAERRRDRHRILHALAEEGLLAPERFREFLTAEGEPIYRPELGEAVHAFLARSRSRLMLVQIEDIAGESEQANLPGTIDGHPNWRRRLAARLDDILANPAMQRTAARVTAERGRSAADRH